MVTTQPILLSLLDSGATRYPDTSSDRTTASGPTNSDLIESELVECLSNSQGAHLRENLWELKVDSGAHIKLDSLSGSLATIILIQGSAKFINPKINEQTYVDKPSSLSGFVVGRKAKIQKGKASVTPIGRGFTVTIDGDKLKVTVNGTISNESVDQVILTQDLGNGQKQEIFLKSGETGFIYWQ